MALKQKGNDGDGGGGGSHPHLLNLRMAHIQCYPIPFLHHQNNNFPIKFIAAASTLFRVFPIHLSLFIQRRTRRRRC